MQQSGFVATKNSSDQFYQIVLFFRMIELFQCFAKQDFTLFNKNVQFFCDGVQVLIAYGIK